VKYDESMTLGAKLRINEEEYKIERFLDKPNRGLVEISQLRHQQSMKYTFLLPVSLLDAAIRWSKKSLVECPECGGRGEREEECMIGLCYVECVECAGRGKVES
jgi:hypothetical protein